MEKEMVKVFLSDFGAEGGKENFEPVMRSGKRGIEVGTHAHICTEGDGDYPQAFSGDS